MLPPPSHHGSRPSYFAGARKSPRSTGTAKHFHTADRTSRLLRTRLSGSSSAMQLGSCLFSTGTASRCGCLYNTDDHMSAPQASPVGLRVQVELHRLLHLQQKSYERQYGPSCPSQLRSTEPRSTLTPQRSAEGSPCWLRPPGCPILPQLQCRLQALRCCKRL